jgi:hypothetical protein
MSTDNKEKEILALRGSVKGEGVHEGTNLGSNG